MSRKRKNASSPKANRGGTSKGKSSSRKMAIVPRNPIAQNPLLKKSHAHTKSNKASRSKDKQKLKKRLAED